MNIRTRKENAQKPGKKKFVVSNESVLKDDVSILMKLVVADQF
jgi:hypothetical protein